MTPWKDIIDRARMEAGSIVPNVKNNYQTQLAWASEAQHEYQKQADVVRRSTVLQIVGFQNGVYKLDTDLKHILDIELVPNPGATPIELLPLPWDSMMRLKRDGSTLDSLNPPQPVNFGAPTHNYYYTKDTRNTLSFYPFVGVTGTLNMRYVPHLSAYSPNNDSRYWQDYIDEKSFNNAIISNGPEPEFNSAIEGIIAYVKMMIIRQEPGGVKAYPEEVKASYETFQAMKYFVGRDDTQTQKRAKLGHLNSPVR